MFGLGLLSTRESRLPTNLGKGFVVKDGRSQCRGAIQPTSNLYRIDWKTRIFARNNMQAVSEEDT
jgi:hypothetical protein